MPQEIMSALIAENPRAFGPEVVIEAPHGENITHIEARLREESVDHARRRKNGGEVLLISSQGIFRSVDSFLQHRQSA